MEESAPYVWGEGVVDCFDDVDEDWGVDEEKGDGVFGVGPGGDELGIWEVALHAVVGPADVVVYVYLLEEVDDEESLGVFEGREGVGFFEEEIFGVEDVDVGNGVMHGELLSR